MVTVTCEPRCDEAQAFPTRLRLTARGIAATLAQGEICPPRHVFSVGVEGETLHILWRVYYSPELLRKELAESRGIDKFIVACLGSRHHDGYLRQECLAVVLAGDAPWLTPYILQLAGEYVVEIVDDIARGIASRDAGPLAAFVRENPGYMATLERRITSYWSCYHRHTYPDRKDYPGSRVAACLRRLVE
ncbi:hypothetical protein [Massilia sp. DD77]|uniref:hypothetical protein n=1 Tax=Massilia sp. DD77 TaxID=3109349 RepID=UPI002FFD8EEE